MSGRDSGIRVSRFARPLLDDSALMAIAETEQFYEAVRREMEKIAAREGFYHVENIYYANAFDAECHRQWLAEERVREAARVRMRWIDITDTETA